jgi:Tfp pilus assembly major pilin PilA
MEVCVLNFHFREHKERVPKWLFKVLLIKDEPKKSNYIQSNNKTILNSNCANNIKHSSMNHVNKSPLIMPPISTASVVVKNNNNQENKKKINLINCNNYNEMNNNIKFYLSIYLHINLWSIHVNQIEEIKLI